MATQKHIDTETADKWHKCAELWKTASDALHQIELILLLDLNMLENPASDAVRKAIDAVEGQAYMFTPQPEWVGGDSSDPKNYKFRPPHIVG